MPYLECPTCKKRFYFEKIDGSRYFPFCSKRCKLVDLGHWLNEDYRISVSMQDEFSEENSDQEYKEE